MTGLNDSRSSQLPARIYRPVRGESLGSVLHLKHARCHSLLTLFHSIASSPLTHFGLRSYLPLTLSPSRASAALIVIHFRAHLFSLFWPSVCSALSMHDPTFPNLCLEMIDKQQAQAEVQAYSKLYHLIYLLQARPAFTCQQFYEAVFLVPQTVFPAILFSYPYTANRTIKVTSLTQAPRVCCEAKAEGE